ncbi:hypothetical protein [Nitrosomonas mobilis]|nr:hypothetical protein [Nitrosomonas mobilis]
MKRSDILDTSKVSSYITEEKANHKFIEVGHIRRAKMHVSCLIEDIDNKNVLTPALRTLLEASLILQTTSAKVLAAHLHRPPPPPSGLSFNRFFPSSEIALEIQNRAQQNMKVFCLKRIATGKKKWRMQPLTVSLCNFLR